MKDDLFHFGSHSSTMVTWKCVHVCEIGVSPPRATEIDIAPIVAGLPTHDPLVCSVDDVALR